MPTSTSSAPLCLRTSGIRKPPPISTASPRDTMTRLPAAAAASPSMTADALLLTTNAASAPVAWQISSATRACRDPREPVSRSKLKVAVPKRGDADGVQAGAA